MTLKQLALELEKNPETVGKLLNRNGLPVERGQPLTPTQISFVRQKYGEAGKPDTLPGHVPDTLPDTRPAPTGQKPDVTKRTKPQVSGGAVRKGALWLVVALTLMTSVQNMFLAAMQMKAHWYSAGMLTAACTFTPALFIYSRASGWPIWFATAGALLYAGYCNTVAVFSALTGLGDSYILKPTPLLEAAASLAGASYQGTALTMSSFLSTVLMAIEVAAIRAISK